MPGGSRNWCFTCNNYSTLLDPSRWDFVVYCIYQEEVGLSGTPHLQGYVQFSCKRTLVTVSKLDGLEHAHLVPARGSPRANIIYCSKKDDKTLSAEPYIFGEESSGQGARVDLVDIALRIRAGVSLKRIAEDHASDFIRYHRGFQALSVYTAPRRSNHETTLCFVFYGAGGTGKSTFARLLAERLSSEDNASGEVYTLPPPKGSGQYWDGYNQGDVVIIDEFKGSRMVPTCFNQLIDSGEHTVPVHGGAVQFNSKYVLITTNVPPAEWWPNIRFQHSLRRRIIMWPIFRRLDLVPRVGPRIIFDPVLGQFRHQ